MRLRLRLSKFDFEVKYNNGHSNFHADALSRLLTLEETQAKSDDEIPWFLAEEHEDTDD